MKPIIAKYLRLSDEDTDINKTTKHESDSIKNQRALLDGYIAGVAEFSGYDVAEYVDDGYTGTNFRRPAAQALIDAAKAGKVCCIIVKDLSRWGRSYLDVGDFLEQKFPLWGVRFISLGDAYDSDALERGAAGDINMAFKGLVAQMYSQDISDKVRAAKDAASKRGKIVTGLPTYGYSFDKNDRHKFIIDDAEAAVVRRIFDLAESGITIAEITRQLNADGVATPLAAKQAKGYKLNAKHSGRWHKDAPRTILRDERYTGKWIYGKSRMARLGCTKAVAAPKDKWIVADGAIPAIVTQEQFARVQTTLS